MFPVKDKRALVKWRDLQPNAKQVAAWWHPWATRTRDADIALRTGDGIVVLDLDPRNGADLSIVEQWPETLTASTPSGGRHCFYSTDEPLTSSTSALAPGLDVKAEGGYVVIPPAEGRDWVRRAPVAPLPAYLLRAVKAARTTGANGESHHVARKEPEDVRFGEIHDQILREVGHLVGLGYDEASARDALHAYVALIPEPLDMDDTHDDVDRCLAWVLSRELA